MDINLLKVAVLTILLVTTMVVGSLPFLCFSSGRNTQSPTRARIFSFLNCLAGGVFFGLCLLDLIPDVNESFEQAFENMSVDVHDFPVAEVSVAVGLLLILIIEQTFLMLQLRFYNDPDGKQTTEERVEEDVGAYETDILLSSSSPGQDPATFGTFNSGRPGERDSEQGGRGVEEMNLKNGEEDIKSQRRKGASSNTGSRTNSSRNLPAGCHGHGHHVTEAVTNEGDADVMHGTRKSAAFRSLLLLSALSFHSILEGIAIGINTHARDVLTLCLGISIHKSVIAFSLSINFLLTMRKLNAFLCLTTFALMSPIGTVCGIYIESAIEGTIWGGILQGLATGTFLYITFFELLNHEIESQNDKLMKILAILLGFGIICALIAFQNFYLNAPT